MKRSKIKVNFLQISFQKGLKRRQITLLLVLKNICFLNQQGFSF